MRFDKLLPNSIYGVEYIYKECQKHAWKYGIEIVSCEVGEVNYRPVSPIALILDLNNM